MQQICYWYDCSDKIINGLQIHPMKFNTYTSLDPYILVQDMSNVTIKAPGLYYLRGSINIRLTRNPNKTDEYAYVIIGINVNGTVMSYSTIYFGVTSDTIDSVVNISHVFKNPQNISLYVKTYGPGTNTMQFNAKSNCMVLKRLT